MKKIIFLYNAIIADENFVPKIFSNRLGKYLKQIREIMEKKSMFNANLMRIKLIEKILKEKLRDYVKK